MKVEVKTFFASSLLHLLVVGSALPFATFPQKSQTPILVDFTIEEGVDMKSVKKEDDSGAPPPVVHTQTTTKKLETVAVAVQAEIAAPHIEPVQATVMSTAVDAVPVVTTMQQAQMPKIASAAGITTVLPEKPDHGGQGGTAGNGADISGTGNGSRGENVETLRMRYMKKNFAYIRDLVAANLRYPGMARRMGWSGKLSVEFVVRESGEIDRIRVLKSSGVPLLDSGAEEAVRRSAPFPKPPVSARLIIPVEYLLE
jgi:TonB family protein